MQRRKVLFPDPDGPIMHMTSFGWTSRSLPCSTWSRPKLLCTASALTIGVTLMPSMPPGEQHGQFLWGRRRRMERDQHPPEALDRRERQPALRAATEISLQVELADRQDRGHCQVPDAGHDRQFDDSEIRAGDLLRSGEELRHRRHKR